MNPDQLLEPFRDLVRRRLWPVALLLVAAAVAAPTLLADPEDVPAPAAAAPTGSEGLDAASIVSVAGPDGTRRRVLGAPKDPFKPSGRHPKPAKPAGTPAAAGGAAPAAAAPDAGTPFGGGAPSAAPASTGGSASTLPAPSFGGPLSPAPAAPASSPAPAASDAPPVRALSVRYDGDRRSLDRLEPLPGGDDPLAIHLGVLPDRRTAVLLLAEGVVAGGDGRCNPSPANCQRLYLRKGEAATLGVAGGTRHRVELLEIETTSAADATPVPSDVAADRRRILRDLVGRVGRLRYDARAGVLRTIAVAAHRAQQARARAAAR